MKIKYKLILFFLTISVIPLLIIGIFTIFISTKGIEEQSYHYIRGNLTSLSLVVNQKNQFYFDASHSIADDVIVNKYLSDKNDYSKLEALRMEQNIVKNLINVRTSTPDIKAIFIVSKDELKISVGIPTMYEQSYFKSTFLHSDLSANIKEGTGIPLFVTGLGGTFERIYLFRNLKNYITGEDLGILVFSIDSIVFSEIFSKVLGDVKGYVYLLNSDRRIIADYPYSGSGFLKSEPESRNVFGAINFFYSNIEIETTLSPGWIIGVKVPLMFFGTGLITIIRAILILSIILIVFSMIFTVFVTGHLSRPIFTLLNSMKKTESGEFIQINEKYNDEFATLFEGYNGMVNQLGRTFEALNESLEQIAINKKEIEVYNYHLEDLVSVRTKELVEAEKMASLGNLVSSVAHEINTPLGIAITSVSYLEDSIQKIKKQMTLGSLVDIETAFTQFLELSDEATHLSINNLKKAANLIISFKRVAVDQGNEDLMRFNVHENIEDIMISLKPKIFHGVHSFKTECPKDVTIKSFPGIFYQIISNFVSNSLIHAFDEKTHDGIMSVSVIFTSNSMLLKYSDNGKGMSLEAAAKVFEPFFTTRRNDGGTGLGMHIVYNLVTQKLKGKIECKSSEGKGTEFTINIPSSEIEPIIDVI